MSEAYVHLNGKLVPRDQAAVSVFDAGFVHGASAYTTMLAHNGKVFRLGRHLKRLMETVDLLLLRTDATAESLASATAELLKANSLSEARVRITLTPGSVRGSTGSPPRATSNGGEGRPTTLITAEQKPQHPASWYEKGISVVVSSFKQFRGDPTFGNKTGCTLSRVLARREAAAKGADDAIWYTIDNHLAEGCTSNVFLVLGGKVFTPPRDTPVLPGIVREAVIEICGRLGIECFDDQVLTVREMLSAGEIFLTSAVAGIRPVVRIERHAVGDEKPGPITKQIMAAYAKLVDEECA